MNFDNQVVAAGHRRDLGDVVVLEEFVVEIFLRRAGDHDERCEAAADQLRVQLRRVALDDVHADHEAGEECADSGRTAGVTTTVFAGAEVFREDDPPNGKALQKFLKDSGLRCVTWQKLSSGTCATGRLSSDA